MNSSSQEITLFSGCPSALACFISIIGIPFGIQHIKLALIALAPIGMQVVPVRR